MRVLLTGATGFVGRQVVRALIAQNVKLRLVVREGKERQVETLQHDAEIIATKDLFAESADWWAEQCRDIDTVIHAAWYAEPGKYLQAPQNMDCLIGSLTLAKGAASAGVKRFVGIGTCFEYDLSSGVLSIGTPLNPLTPYAAAKVALYMSLSQWLPSQLLEFAWCRLFYLYGEGEDERRLVPYLRKQLAKGEPAELTSGNQIRDFLDVADAAQMIVDIALGNKTGPVNICSGIPVTVRQLAEQIANQFGRRDLLVLGARPENVCEPLCVVGVKDEL